MQPRGRAAGDQDREPVHDGREHREDAPQPEPDEVRDREEQPEEDGQAAAGEVLLDRYADRMRAPLRRLRCQVGCRETPRDIEMQAIGADAMARRSPRARRAWASLSARS